jgi:hypothetical protein
MSRFMSKKSNSQPNTFQLSRRFVPVLLSSVMVLSARATFAQSMEQAMQPDRSASLAVELSQQSNQGLPQRVANQVRRDLAQRLNVPLQDLSIAGYSRETWQDSCLGLGGPAELCAAMLVEGWRVEVTDADQSWFYRTDLTAQTMRLEETGTHMSELPQAVAEQVLAEAAKQLVIPVGNLKIAQAESRTWDGCLGIYEMGQMCTMIGILGWQVIVTDSEGSWIYHTNQDGSQIADNKAASGSSGGLLVEFLSSPPAALPEDVVFQAIAGGGITGRTVATMLMRDGRILQDSKVIRRLSRQQVQQFELVLQQQQFPNIGGLRYWDDGVADAIDIQFMAMGSTIHYMDAMTDRLPPALQSVVSAWNDLVN